MRALTRWGMGACPWVGLGICLAICLGGCSSSLLLEGVHVDGERSGDGDGDGPGEGDGDAPGDGDDDASGPDASMDDPGLQLRHPGACDLPLAELPDCGGLMRHLPPPGVRQLRLYHVTDVLGPGATIVAAGGNALWVRDGEGDPLVVDLRALLDDPGSTPPHRALRWDGAPGPWSVRAVFGLRSDGPDELGVLALVCADGQCAVLSGSHGDDGPLTFAVRVPDGVEPTGIVAEQAELCVYGTALHCLRGGTWFTEAPADDARPLRSVALGERSLAVGDGGRLLVRDDEAFALVAGVEADLRSVDSLGRRWVAVGDAWVGDHGVDAPDCLPTPLPEALWLAHGDGHPRSWLRFESGDIALRARGDADTPLAYCGYTRVDAAPVGHGQIGCGGADNPFVATQFAVFGLSSEPPLCVTP